MMLNSYKTNTYQSSERKRYMEISTSDLEVWNRYWNFILLPCHRKARFHVYQQKHRTYYQIARELCMFQGSFQNTKTEQPFANVVVLWGNGSFKATSKGHNVAPNKGLRLGLSRYLDMFVVDEYNTSKKTGCCHSPSKFPAIPEEHLSPCKSACPIKQQRRLNRIGCKHRDLLYCHCQVDNHPETGVKRVVKCRPWRRDISAARNIFVAFRHLLYYGERAPWARRSNSTRK